MSASPSLFDAGSGGGLQGASDWLLGLLSGPAVTSLCVVAVAILGIAMLSGRIAARRAAQVVLGCFLVLGAASLATEVRDIAADADGAKGEPVELIVETQRPPPLPPANYDPYATASMPVR